MMTMHTYYFRHVADYGPTPTTPLIEGVISDSDWETTRWALENTRILWGPWDARITILSQLSEPEWRALDQRLSDENGCGLNGPLFHYEAGSLRVGREGQPLPPITPATLN